MRTLNRLPYARILKSTVGPASVGWLWVVVLLALPNCSLDRRGIGSGMNLNAGRLPRSSAIFCDIERETGRRCSTPEDRAMSIRLAAAAVALNTGQTSGFGLDESPDALARCGGVPEVVPFQHSFPEGTSVCLNCEVIGPPSATPTPTYANANAACVAKCEDVLRSSGPTVPPPAAVVAFCESHTHVSTNFSSCAADVCTSSGIRGDFVDPRRTPEPVVWSDRIGVSAVGNNLSRAAPATGVFDAGAAASTQRITRGDAYVEFSASENNRSHVIGFSEIAAGCVDPCADTDPGITDINFAISLNLDGNVYVLESGAVIASFGAYTAGERFRVTLTDKFDSRGTITYSRIIGSCTPGTPCPETVLFTHTSGPATYPLRVDASFRESGATLTDVRLVRIQ